MVPDFPDTISYEKTPAFNPFFSINGKSCRVNHRYPVNNHPDNGGQ
jgi:hypothetical protein